MLKIDGHDRIILPIGKQVVTEGVKEVNLDLEKQTPGRITQLGEDQI